MLPIHCPRHPIPPCLAAKAPLSLLTSVCAEAISTSDLPCWVLSGRGSLVFPNIQWIGVRENLQETLVFPCFYMFLPWKMCFFEAKRKNNGFDSSVHFQRFTMWEGKTYSPPPIKKKDLPPFFGCPKKIVRWILENKDMQGDVTGDYRRNNRDRFVMVHWLVRVWFLYAWTAC